MKEVTKFIFGVDENTGIFGCLPEKYKESEFNYSWDYSLIFHDVVEHYQENTHKYFREEYAWNIGGEMSAMGALYYLYDAFTLSKRFNSNSYYNPEQLIMNVGKSDLLEAGCHGGFSYGYELLCNIPYQKPVCSCMEDMIIQQYNEFTESGIQTNDEQDLEYCRLFRESVTLDKLRRFYRWGYRSAERRFPNTFYSRTVLNGLLNDLQKLTSGSVEDFAQEYESFTVILFTGKELDYKIKLKKHDYFEYG